MRRLGRTRKLFAFLRTHRHALFDEAFQAELAAGYRESGAGRDAIHRPCWRWPCCYKGTWGRRMPKRSS